MSLLDVIAVFGFLKEVLATAGWVCDEGEFAHVGGVNVTGGG